MLSIALDFRAVRCQLLDPDSCRCGDYPNRQQKVLHNRLMGLQPHLQVTNKGIYDI